MSEIRIKLIKEGLEKLKTVILPLLPVNNSFLVQPGPIVKERIPVATGVN